MAFDMGQRFWIDVAALRPGCSFFFLLPTWSGWGFFLTPGGALSGGLLEDGINSQS